MKLNQPDLPGRPQPVISDRLAKWLGLPIVDHLVYRLKVAAAASERTHDYDGFLSYHAETHAIAAGFGIGFAIGAASRWSLLGALLAALVAGNRGETPFDRKLFHDIRSEFHYFIVPLALGIVAGVAVRILAGGGL